ncbi:hypothetical protein SYNPS1DRAFT_26933 [Syncephalis pseudoplumigaleata]|uniref:RanBP2-type domain-containing protein n=1 Tax=Syncephalis pseudoplumigaleata TaxID=1712513 RepID=A0A4P9Z4J4_9FUNG|nr:hypothetical protein SYNPS1DRAFT_26933 [Syncephalis pseudoplumigaleata]|eukprot:RKP27416.1 hypothetical protein SYNPS1DRAFT_26933 [Syncephalis pseudoplumigaleata]
MTTLLATRARTSAAAVLADRSRRYAVVEDRRHFNDFKPHDWVCTGCQAHNFARRRQCWECGQSKPEKDGEGDGDGSSGSSRTSSQLQNMSNGDWECPDCKFRNFAKRRNCFRCKAEKPHSSDGGVPFVPSTLVKEWTCGECGHGSHIAYAACQQCGFPRNRLQELRDQEHAMQQIIRGRSHDWLCGHCASHNFVSRISCRDCGMPYDQKARAITSIPEEDWVCPRCSTENPNTRYQCTRCNKKAPYLLELLKQPTPA